MSVLAGSTIVTPGALVRAVDALLGQRGDRGEVDAVVDPEREVRIGERMGLHAAARTRAGGAATSGR